MNTAKGQKIHINNLLGHSIDVEEEEEEVAAVVDTKRNFSTCCPVWDREYTC